MTVPSRRIGRRAERDQLTRSSEQSPAEVGQAGLWRIDDFRFEYPQIAFFS
jgi:hypothetical protein